MLALEPHYRACAEDSYGSRSPQDEIRPHMRAVVAEWMLDVCADQVWNSTVHKVLSDFFRLC